jgi:TonB family protein
MINHLLQSTAFAIVIALLTLVFRKHRASIRHALWLIASIKFLVPFEVLVAVGRQLWPMGPIGFAESEPVRIATALFASSAYLSLGDASWLRAVWLAGMAAVILAWWRQWKQLAQIVDRAIPMTAGREHAALRRVEYELGMKRPIAIVSSAESIEPGVVGIRNPILLWPMTLSASLSDEQIAAIVAHEVHHVRRQDNLLALLHLIVSALFWFYPFVWWIGARLTDERERACDEAVLAMGQRPMVYATSILKTCELGIASPVVGVSGVTGGELKRRIARIMENDPAAPLRTRAKISLGVGLMMMLVTPIVAGVAAPASLPGPAAVLAAQDDDREVHRPGGNVTAPKLLREVKPQYSARAMQEKIEGEVLMECVVKSDGTVGDIKIVKELHPDLDQAAMDAASQWLFEPGKRDGKPVNVLVTITMAFTLKK